MILIDKDTVLTADLITSYIQTFNTTDRLKYQKYFDYYKGNQAIMLKTVTDTSKPCNKIVTVITSYSIHYTKLYEMLCRFGNF